MSFVNWPNQLPITQVQIVRRTQQLTAIINFYRDGLGLVELESFEDQQNHAGVRLGLPQQEYQLMFIQAETPEKMPSSDKDQLLVLQVADKEAIGRMVVKLGALGYFPITPPNSYWQDKGVMIADPDGYSIVLYETEQS